MKESPHGKSSVRRTWRWDRVSVPFASSSSSRVPAAQSLFLKLGTASRGVGPGRGVEGRRGSEATRLAVLAKAPVRSGEYKLFSLQVQEVSSQVLTHSSEQGEECGEGKGRKGRKEKLVLLSSLGTSAHGTRGPARGRLRDSGGDGWALRASSAAAHGSGQPSWATPGPGKGTATISVPGESPPRITLPYSSAPP